MRKYKVLRNEAGITLIELLATMALVGIIAAGLMSIYWFGASAYEREYKQADVQYDARSALDKMTKDISECNDLEVLDKDDTVLEMDTEPTESQKPVQLRLVDAEGAVIIYKTDNEGRLQRQESGDSKTLTINKADTVFIDQGNGLVKIQMSILSGDEPVFTLNRLCRKKVD